jgi:hypothetical protein
MVTVEVKFHLFLLLLPDIDKQLFLLSNSLTPEPNVAKVLDTKLNGLHFQF